MTPIPLMSHRIVDYDAYTLHNLVKLLPGNLKKDSDRPSGSSITHTRRRRTMWAGTVATFFGTRSGIRQRWAHRKSRPFSPTWRQRRCDDGRLPCSLGRPWRADESSACLRCDGDESSPLHKRTGASAVLSETRSDAILASAAGDDGRPPSLLGDSNHGLKPGLRTGPRSTPTWPRRCAGRSPARWMTCKGG